MRRNQIVVWNNSWCDSGVKTVLRVEIRLFAVLASRMLFVHVDLILLVRGEVVEVAAAGS